MGRSPGGEGARRALAATKNAATGKLSRQAARGRELLDLIARRVQRIKEDFFEIGVALKELKEKKLFVALGHRTFDDLLHAMALLGRSQAYKLVAIVDHVSREQALELGEERAYALARFVRATPQADTIDSVLDAGMTVNRKKRDVRSMSRREIESAARAAERASSKPSDAEREARRVARETQARLRKHSVAATVTVVHHAGEWWATVRMPAHQLRALAARAPK